MKISHLLTVTFAVAVSAAAHNKVKPVDDIEDTTKKDCHHNNVLRCLIRHPIEATPFCQSYISIPVVTKEIGTSTPIVTVTVAAGVKVPRAPGLVRRAISNATTTTAPAIKNVNPLAKLQRPTVTPAARLFARAPVIAPTCLTQVSATSYAPSRISSACSCINLPTPTVSVIITASPITVTVVAPADAVTTPSTSTSAQPPDSIPTGLFKISSPTYPGSYLGGYLDDDYYTGFNLPYGEYELQFKIDLATGYVTATAPGRLGAFYLVAFTGLLSLEKTIPYIVTESSPDGPLWTPLKCFVGKDTAGNYPLMCRADIYTVTKLVNINGDGNRELGIARPADQSGQGFINLFAVFL